MRSFSWGMLALFTAAMVGCGGDDNPPPADATPEFDAPSIPDAATPDAYVPPGDGNDSFNDAVDLVIDGPGATDGITTPGDHDYFRINATAGDWLRIATDANPTDDPDMLDTVISMFGPDSTTVKIAENDDAVPRRTTDSEIIIRIPTTGVYYFEVQDYTDWSGGGIPEFGPAYIFTISVAKITPTSTQFTVEPATDPGNDAATATAITVPVDGTFQRLLGKFDTGTDMDVYSFNMPADGLIELAAMPDGPTGYGSTADIGDMWVADAAGATIIGRVNASQGPFDGPFEVIPFLPAGDYTIFVQRQAGAGGTNDFWVGKVSAGMENPKEREVAVGDNDTIVNAQMSGETVTMTAVDPMTDRGFLYSELSTDTDVDIFQVACPAGRNITVRCSSALVGSGNVGFQAQLLRPDNSVVAMDTESLVDGVNIQNAPAGVDANYYVRLSKTSQDAQVTGTYARCVVFTFVP